MSFCNWYLSIFLIPDQEIVWEERLSNDQGCRTTQTSQWFRFWFFTGSCFSSSSGSGPAQQAKTNATRLRLSTRCFPWGRALCTNWLHTGADLIQGIISYVRIKTRTLKKFFCATLTRKPYLMHSENSHLCEHREILTFEGN